MLGTNSVFPNFPADLPSMVMSASVHGSGLLVSVYYSASVSTPLCQYYDLSTHTHTHTHARTHTHIPHHTPHTLEYHCFGQSNSKAVCYFYISSQYNKLSALQAPVHLCSVDTTTHAATTPHIQLWMQTPRYSWYWRWKCRI